MRKADCFLRWRSRPDMSMSDYLDAQAKYDRAADQDDIFEICRAIVGGQKPFSAMEKSHVSVLAARVNELPNPPQSKTKLRRRKNKSKD